MSDNAFSAVLKAGNSHGQKSNLIDGIKDVLLSYSYGVKCFQEYVQNSEDAVGKEVAFMVDFDSEKGPPHSRGPALLIYNDQIFTQQDLLNIVNFKNTDKRNSLANVGKFGQGFMVGYHYGDIIEILSDDFYQILDPHCFTPLVNNKDNPGTFVRYFGNKNVDLQEQMKSILSPFFGKFSFNEDDYLEKRFSGTIIRIPLRKSNNRSRISPKSHSPTKIRDELVEYSNEFYKLLLFQMHIKKITVFEGSNILYRCQVEILDDKEEERNRFISSFEEEITRINEGKQKKIRDYELNIRMKMKIERFFRPKNQIENLHFLMSHQIDTHGELFQKCLVTKASPFEFRLLPHLAICANIEYLRGLKETTHELFCGLSLGITTGYPFHLHSRFELQPNRNNIMWGQKDCKRSEWNRMIMKTLFPKVYIQFLHFGRFLLENDYLRLFPDKKFFTSDISLQFGLICKQEIVKEMKERTSKIIRMPESKRFVSIEDSPNIILQSTLSWLKDMLSSIRQEYGVIRDESFEILELNESQGMTAEFFLSVLEKNNIRENCVQLFSKHLVKIWITLERLIISHGNKKAFEQRIKRLRLIPVNDVNGKFDLVCQEGNVFVSRKTERERETKMVIGGDACIDYFSEVIPELKIFNEKARSIICTTTKMEIFYNSSYLKGEEILEYLYRNRSGNVGEYPPPSNESQRKAIFNFVTSLSPSVVHRNGKCLRRLPIYRNIKGEIFAISKTDFVPRNVKIRHPRLSLQRKLSDLSSSSGQDFPIEILETYEEENPNLGSFFHQLQLNVISIEEIFVDIINNNNTFEESFNDQEKEELILNLLSWEEKMRKNNNNNQNNNNRKSVMSVLESERFEGLCCVKTQEGWANLLSSIDPNYIFKNIFGESKNFNFVFGKMSERPYILILRHFREFRLLKKEVLILLLEKIQYFNKWELAIPFLQYLERNLNIFQPLLLEIRDIIQSLKIFPGERSGILGSRDHINNPNEKNLLLVKISQLCLEKHIKICSQNYFSIFPDWEKKTPKLMSLLGFNDRREPDIRYVIDEILEISRIFNDPKRSQRERLGLIRKGMTDVLRTIYQRFEKEVETVKEVLMKDPNNQWVFVGNKIGFVSPMTCAVQKNEHLVSVREIVNFIPSEFLPYYKMFLSLGVRAKFELKDMIDVYSIFTSQFGEGHPLNNEQTENIRRFTRAIWKSYENRIESFESEEREERAEQLAESIRKKMVLIPSNKWVLKKVSSLVFDDIPQFQTKKFEEYCDQDLPQKLCVFVLGMRSKANILIQKESNRLDMSGVWEVNNQVRPPYVTVIRGFLNENGEGDGIISELLQNADDAKASEVIIMYNEEQYGDLVSPGYGGSGRDSVIIFNDAIVTEKDWTGLQKPCRSVKSEDCEKIGRFGVGIGVLYHIGEFFEVVSGKNYGIMKPQEERFERMDFLRNGDILELRDQFRTPFENVIENRKIDFSREYPHTIIRIPVRKEEDMSEMKSGIFEKKNFLEILHSFKKDGKAQSCLLFLRHVKKLRIQVRSATGEVQTLLQVEKKEKRGGASYLQNFKKLVSLKKNLNNNNNNETVKVESE